MSIKEITIILFFILRGVLTHCQPTDTIASSLFYKIRLDSTQEAIISFIEKSDAFNQKKIYSSESYQQIHGSLKSMRYFKYEPDTAFIETGLLNAYESGVPSKGLSVTILQIFKSNRKAREEFKDLKKYLDKFIDSSMRDSFTINEDKSLNFRYRLIENRSYPAISISLETDRDPVSVKKYKVLSIVFEKILK